MLNKDLILQMKQQKRQSYRQISRALGYSSSCAFFKILNSGIELKACKVEQLAKLLGVQIQDLFIPTPSEGGDCK